MRVTILFLDIVITIDIVIGIDNLVVVPLPIVNTGLFLSLFQSRLCLILGLWRVRNLQNLVMDIQTWIDNGYHTALTFIALRPCLRNLDNLIGADTAWFSILRSGRLCYCIRISSRLVWVCGCRRLYCRTSWSCWLGLCGSWLSYLLRTWRSLFWWRSRSFFYRSCRCFLSLCRRRLTSLICTWSSRFRRSWCCFLHRGWTCRLTLRSSCLRSRLSRWYHSGRWLTLPWRTSCCLLIRPSLSRTKNQSSSQQNRSQTELVFTEWKTLSLHRSLLTLFINHIIIKIFWQFIHL